MWHSHDNLGMDYRIEKLDYFAHMNTQNPRITEALDLKWKNQLQQFRDMVHLMFDKADRVAWVNHSTLGVFRVFSAGHYVEAHHHLWERRNLAEGVYIYCTAGRGFYRCGNREWQVGPGELLYCPPLSHHRYGADQKNPWTIFWFHVSGPEISVYSKLLGFTPQQPVIRVGIRPRAIAAFHTLFHFLKPPLTESRMAALGGAGRLLLATFAMESGEESATEEIGAGIQRVMDFMENHVEDQAEVDQWLKLFGGSRSHFQRQFKLSTGHGPHDYFLRLKIRRACGYLMGSGLRIAEIGERLGFKDPFYFSRLFRKITGGNPRAYRTRAAQHQDQ